MAPQDPHILLQTLAKLEHLRDPRRAKSHRRFNRWVVRGDAEIHAVNDPDNPHPLRIHIRDVSWGGLGFVCDRFLLAQALWRVHFLYQEQVVGHQSVLVRHCRQVGDGLYLIGGQFVIDAGLMCLLGVDPHSACTSDGPEIIPAFFQAPSEVA